MKRLLLSIFVFTALFSVNAQPKELLEKGNNAYIESKYTEAIDYYNQILSQGYSSATLYYNLGNSFYKTNQISSAILNYERAKLLAPGDENIDYNLNMARLYVVDKIDVLPEFFISKWKRSIINTMSSDWWSYFATIFTFAFLIVGIVYFWSTNRSIRKVFFFSGFMLLLLSAVCVKFAIDQKDNVIDHNKAIVFSHSVTLKSSPDESGTNLFLLHEGFKVDITDTVGDWYEIKVSDGNKGWLKKSDVELI